MVVGTTGDAATPLVATQNRAKALEDGVLITVNAQQHTGYRANTCVTKAVDNFLVNQTRPAAGLTC